MVYCVLKNPRRALVSEAIHFDIENWSKKRYCHSIGFEAYWGRTFKCSVRGSLWKERDIKSRQSKKGIILWGCQFFLTAVYVLLVQ
jgi:hypothetical protein